MELRLVGNNQEKTKVIRGFWIMMTRTIYKMKVFAYTDIYIYIYVGL